MQSKCFRASQEITKSTNIIFFHKCKRKQEIQLLKYYILIKSKILTYLLIIPCAFFEIVHQKTLCVRRFFSVVHSCCRGQNQNSEYLNSQPTDCFLCPKISLLFYFPSKKKVFMKFFIHIGSVDLLSHFTKVKCNSWTQFFCVVLVAQCPGRA